MKRKINYDNWSKEELIKELRRIKETKYGLVWHRDLPEEKIDILINPDARTPSEMFPNEMAGRPFPVLKEVKNRAIESDGSKPVNLLIEGDNYHSLAVLNFTHQEAIDVIYIDPPYNTGNNDFIYRDKFESDYVKNDDPFRHSKWISFMERRLKLAKNLLSKKGAIFISIDDNEYGPLKLLCDELLGEVNFLGTIVRRRRGSQANLSKNISTIHEYVLCYAKGRETQLNRLTFEAKIDDFKNPDKDSRGPYVTMPCTNKGGAKYTITTPTGKKHTDEWRFKEETYLELLKDSRIVFPKKGDGKPRYKLFLKEKEGSGVIASTWWDDAATNQEATSELKALFGGELVFNNPKPVGLIKRIIALASDKNSTILDFMAGSGTTGHAVMELNKEDGGQRQFILCTNNENNICTDVCYPRIKKVIEGYKNLKKEKVDGLGGNLRYYTCDFVEAKPTDLCKRKLVNECTEMLCIHENTFELVQDDKDFKIFRNGDRYLGIVFYEDAIDDFKKAIVKIKGHCNAYIFSMTDDPNKSQFADVASKVTLCAIPEVILKVYREIFKEQ
ncbi:MAG: site-specific DNA-methyltransferase [Candidatus Buchananbacteria bacterium]